jgi:hypothetical protein
MDYPREEHRKAERVGIFLSAVFGLGFGAILLTAASEEKPLNNNNTGHPPQSDVMILGVPQSGVFLPMPIPVPRP